MSRRSKNKERARTSTTATVASIASATAAASLSGIASALTVVYRSDFYRIIGPAPILAAGDHHGAQEYLALVEGAIKQGLWTIAGVKSETARVRLWKLKAKWQKRAEGRDAWFEAYGNKSPRAEMVEAITRKTRSEIEEEARAKVISRIVEGARADVDK